MRVDPRVDPDMDPRVDPRVDPLDNKKYLCERVHAGYKILFLKDERVHADKIPFLIKESSDHQCDVGGL